MANLEAVVATGQGFRSGVATGDVVHVTGYVATDNTTAVTRFLDKFNARWAALLTVTVVTDWMCAWMLPGAHIGALRGLGPTRYGGIDDLVTTETVQFVEADVVAGVTRSTMTEFLTAMRATRQFPTADLVASVLRVHTASFPTLVSSALSLLVASSIADVIFHFDKLLTRYILL